MLVDSFQRRIEYLRFSLTDLCNIRCHYCMPLEGIVKKPRSEILSFEEIVRMVSILVPLGIRRVRLTGGEPLVRQGLPDLIQKMKDIEGLEEILLTTNGILLKPIAADLKKAGLEKINIHLDTLSPEKFKKITRLGDIEKVFEGIEEARRVGLQPIKLNAVIQKGINDDEIEDLLLFCSERGLILRLIEMMPIGPGREMMAETFLASGVLRKKLEEKYVLKPVETKLGKGPAVYYRVEGVAPRALPVEGATRAPITLLGFISAISEPFCDSCNRIRISSDGRFQDCLAFDGTFSFRDLLRNPAYSDEDISEEVLGVLQGKRKWHEQFQQAPDIRTPCMVGIGG
ncbi:MAG: GTP 3',8-cyclase MoaA [Deltaproteobacteria bacterium]|nr:GTP 3',8-cyclase MoaA [Deltaproteobacteria bacterium]